MLNTRNISWKSKISENEKKSLYYATSNNEITHPAAKSKSESGQAYKVPDKLEYE